MNYYMICHLFSFLQKRRVRTAARLPPLRPRLFVLSYLLGLERGGEGSLPVHTCGRKARERTVQGGAVGFRKAFYAAVTPTEHRGQGRVVFTANSKEVWVLSWRSITGDCFPLCFFNESWRIFIGFCWDFHFLWPAGIKAARSFWV